MEYDAEKITPYGSGESKTGQVRRMFDNIATVYDVMDHAMSLGLDKRWRRKAAKIVAKSEPKTILDMATGTGDFALALRRNVASVRSITGVDISPGMIEVAKQKLEAAGADVTLVVGDGMRLPFGDGSFDAVTVAFGVRNFESLEKGIAEMARTLASGGTLCIIELTLPTNPVIKPLYKLYTRLVIPAGGKMVARDRRAYAYLPHSIEAMPQGEEMLDIIRRAGLEQCKCRCLTMGVCAIYTAIKP